MLWHVAARPRCITHCLRSKVCVFGFFLIFISLSCSLFPLKAFSVYMVSTENGSHQASTRCGPRTLTTAAPFLPCPPGSISFSHVFRLFFTDCSRHHLNPLKFILEKKTKQRNELPSLSAPWPTSVATQLNSVLADRSGRRLMAPPFPGTRGHPGLRPFLPVTSLWTAELASVLHALCSSHSQTRALGGPAAVWAQGGGWEGFPVCVPSTHRSQALRSACLWA